MLRGFWWRSWEGKVYLVGGCLKSDNVWRGVMVPITDPVKKAIAQRARLYMKICRSCGVRNAPSAVKCRKCHSKNLRWKKRELVR